MTPGMLSWGNCENVHEWYTGMGVPVVGSTLVGTILKTFEKFWEVVIMETLKFNGY